MSSDARFDGIATHLAEDRAAWRLPGMAAVLVVDGRAVWSGGFGRIDDSGTAANAETVWRVASVGQPVLAAAMGHLAGVGALALDDPLTRWLPEAAALSSSDAPITLADCAAHSSGLPPMPAMSTEELEALRFPTIEALLADLDGVKDGMVSKPGRCFSYSNLAWALLSEALSRAAGRPIVDYATEHVLAPLGMSHSGWLSPEPNTPGHATGFGAFGDPPVVAPEPTLGAFAPQWGLWTTAADMARFLAWQLSSDETRGRTRLPAGTRPPTNLETLRALQSPRLIEANKATGATPGWLVGLTTAGPTLFHGGADPGFAAYATLAPRLGLATFLAANRASNPEALGEMAHGILGFAREVLGR